MFVKAKEYIKDVDIIGDLNNTVSVQFGANSSEVSDSASSESDDVHRIDLEAFGQQMQLNLKKQEGLFKKEGLKMWRTMTNDSQPHGVDYEELEMVSFFCLLFIKCINFFVVLVSIVNTT